MSGRTPRTIGTSESSIADAERDLGRVLPPSFRSWLLENNGRSIDVVDIFPVFDLRDPRKTWDSIVRNYNGNWQEWQENVAEWGFDSTMLLPIGTYSNGDYCCLDYSNTDSSGEVPIVLWSHETGDTEFRANNFAEFLTKLEAGEFDDD